MQWAEFAMGRDVQLPVKEVETAAKQHVIHPFVEGSCSDLFGVALYFHHRITSQKAL